MEMSPLSGESLKDKYLRRTESIKLVGKPLLMEGTQIREQEITPENLVFVRADSFPPRVTGEGVMILNALDATGGKIERKTNHFALNHKVTANSGGSWEEAPYTYITPGVSMIEANGLPDNLYSVDTFWSRSVSLPPGSVIVYPHGAKPDLGEYESQFVLVERDNDVRDEHLTSLILKRMGYTEIVGLDHSAGQGHEAFDKAITEYAARNGIRSSLHRESWSQAWEEARTSIKEKRYAMAFSTYLFFSDNPREAIFRKDGEEELLRDIFSVFDKNEFEDEKRLIVDKFNRALMRGIQKETLLKAAPASMWEYIKKEMRSLVGDTLDGFSDEEEVKEVFEEMYQRSYEA